MKFVLLLTFVFSVALCFGSPTDTSVLVRQRRELDLFDSSRALIKELISNWRNAVQQGVDSITTFQSGLHDLAVEFREKLVADVQDYRDRVQETIKNITTKFGEVGAAVRECIETHQQEADEVFRGVFTNSRACADNRINDIRVLIMRLKDLNINATDYIDNSLEEMQNCTQNGDGFLTTGACLGGITIRTEVKGAVFIAQTGVLIARINIALASLPAALDICAGTSIIEAGVGSAKVIIEIGRCSVSSAFPSVTGNSTAV